MIRFAHTATFQDYWRLNLRHLLRAYRLNRLIPFAALSLAVFILSPWVIFGFKGKPLLEVYSSVWGLLILPVLTLLMVISTYFGARKNWNAIEELREEKE